MGFSIKTTTEEDILHYLLSVKDYMIPPLDSPTRELSIAQYAKYIHTETVKVEAWENNQLIGLSATDENWITHFSVLQSFWGSNVASGLMQKTKEQLSILGYQTIELRVNIQNIRAHNFYLKHNFNIVKTDDTFDYMRFSF